MVVRIEPTILFVSKFGECVEFYRDVLGLVPKDAEPAHEEFVEFDVGGMTFALHGGYEGETHATGPLAIHFEVGDIFATVRELRKVGAEVGEPKKFKEMGFYECSFQDPDGNEFDLIQPLPSPSPSK